MKRILIVLALLMASPVLGAPTFAAEPVTFRAISSVVITSLTTVHPLTSTAFNPYTKFIRAVCTVDCLIAVVSTPIVAGTSRPVFLPSMAPEYFIVTPGQHVIVRADSASGSLYLNEMDR